MEHGGPPGARRRWARRYRALRRAQPGPASAGTCPLPQFRRCSVRWFRSRVRWENPGRLAVHNPRKRDETPMCGIVGYIGEQQVAPLLIQGLKRLEYRGYDSAGIAVAKNGHLLVRKEAGKIAELEKMIVGDPVEGVYGIGHTRWATHGPPNQRNAHPHVSEDGDFALVHNGIIENAQPLKRRLQQKGHVFSSDTDTEVLVHLIEDIFNAGVDEDGGRAGKLERAVEKALQQIEGTYGIAVISSKDPKKIVAARLGSPLLIGVGEA